jgi:hypothetical protein
MTMKDRKIDTTADQLELINRFQMKELFWDIKAECKTNDFRRELWNTLDKQMNDMIQHSIFSSVDDQMYIIKRWK